MMAARSNSLVRSALCILLVFASWVSPVRAQEPPRLQAELSGGWVGFPDDGVVNEALVGGALGWYIGPRVTVGPELALVQGDTHRHVLLTGRIAMDLAAAGRRPVIPYVVLAGGLSQTHYQHPDADVTTRDGLLAAGAGLRASVGRRVTVGMEGRAGWRYHLRVTGTVGVKLGP